MTKSKYILCYFKFQAPSYQATKLPRLDTTPIPDSWAPGWAVRNGPAGIRVLAFPLLISSYPHRMIR